MKQNWTKRPDVWVVVAETKCCGFLSHDPKSPALPVHWDMKRSKWIRCKVKAYWKLAPVARVNRKGESK